MAVSSSLSRITNWLRSLVRNPYFWGGVGALLLIAGIGYLAVDALIMPSYTRHGVSVSMPNVQSQTFEQAKAVMQEHGLRVNRQVGRFNPNVPQDVVVDQTPPPGAPVKPDRRVYLTVNSGRQKMVTLPDLSGTSLREARNRLATLGLSVDTMRIDSIPSPYANTITRHKPAPGDSLKEGGAVTLWYSRGLGTERVRVPDVHGLPVDSAKQRLLAQKLRWVVVDTASLSASGGGRDARFGTRAAQDTSARTPTLFVRSQGRSPGDRVRAGTEVRLYPTADSTWARDRRRTLPDSSRMAPADSLRRIGF